MKHQFGVVDPSSSTSCSLKPIDRVDGVYLAIQSAVAPERATLKPPIKLPLFRDG